MYKLKKIVLILALLLPRRGNMKTSNSCLCSLLLFFFGLKCAWNTFYETSHLQLHIDISVYCSMSLIRLQYVWHLMQHMGTCISYLVHREGNQMFFQSKFHAYSKGIDLNWLYCAFKCLISWNLWIKGPFSVSTILQAILIGVYCSSKGLYKPLIPFNPLSKGFKWSSMESHPLWRKTMRHPGL